MSNVMAALPNIGGALCSAPQSLADAAAGVPCSNAANIGDRKTWTQSEPCSCQNSLCGQEPHQNVYIMYQPRRWPNTVQSLIGLRWATSLQVTKARRETRWNLVECPKQPNRSQPSMCRCSPYCEDMWRRYCCKQVFFPIVDICLSCKDTARQSCAMVHRWRIFGDFLRLVFSTCRVQHVSGLHSKFALSSHHV